MNIENIIKTYLGNEVYKYLVRNNDLNLIQEIRIRKNLPVTISINRNKYFISKNGLTDDLKSGIITTSLDIKNIFEKMAEYSAYAFNDDIKKGYITLKGGHRVGICGKIVLDDNEKIKTIKDITALNIRISHEIENCSREIVNKINKNFGHTIIISPPNCGKTTMLRDMIKILSSEKKLNVGVVDERKEINNNDDLGLNTDVLDGCPKSIGMMMLLRSMSPDVIAVDEIGRKEDIIAIEEIVNSGVKILCTVHSSSINELLKKENLKDLMENTFENYIILDSPVGTNYKIYDKDKKLIYNKVGCL